MKIRVICILLLTVAFESIYAQPVKSDKGKLTVSDNGRYLCYEDGTPFFWLGDTGWLLGINLNREEAEHYMNTRRDQGFNVVQMMLMWSYPVVNTYGQYFNTDFEDFEAIDQSLGYGYWDHIDYIVDLATRKGLYIAMLPTWGLVVNRGLFNKEKAYNYAKFLALRYKDKPNIIWVNGGDVDAGLKPEIWHTLGETLKKYDPNHLMTFHPRGSRTSVTWFHDAPWLDFHMFQSGHRRYGQNMSRDAEYSGNYQEEDGWRFVEEAQNLEPLKPILDGEPSYEGIPQGLRSASEPRWGDSDARRYAYWSVFAGSCGHTYGNNAVMLMHKPGYRELYHNNRNWFDAIYDPGAQQMKYLKELIMRFPFFDRIPDQSVIAGTNGERYDRSVATRGKDYMLIYTYNGNDLKIDMTKISGKDKKVWWMKPSSGEYTYLGNYQNGIQTFFPPGRYRQGNDWVLIITDADSKYDL
jgi:hypothetical protein